MPQKYRAAAIQMRSGANKAENLRQASALVEAAAADGAELIALPEMFACLGSWRTMLEAAEPIPGPTSQFLSDLARRLNVVLVGGSFCERASMTRDASTTRVCCSTPAGPRAGTIPQDPLVRRGFAR